MNKFYIALMLLHILPWSAKSCHPSMKPLQMTVLYESLCPDSQAYIKKLWPVFQKYHQCINLTLVPYGKASPSKQTQWGHVCQHGRAECWGNRMQDCALHSDLNQLDQMRFLTCQMQDLRLAMRQDFKCAQTLNIMNHVKSCIRPNGRGNQLQAKSSTITKQYGFNVIPAIVYNGVFSENLQKDSRNNVKQTLCKILVETNHVLPDDC